MIEKRNKERKGSITKHTVWFLWLFLCCYSFLLVHLARGVTDRESPNQDASMIQSNRIYSEHGFVSEITLEHCMLHKGLVCGMQLFQHGFCLFGRHFVNVVPISYDMLSRNCRRKLFSVGKENENRKENKIICLDVAGQRTAATSQSTLFGYIAYGVWDVRIILKKEKKKNKRKRKISYSAQSHSVIYARFGLEISETFYVEKQNLRFVLQDWIKFVT